MGRANGQGLPRRGGAAAGEQLDLRDELIANVRERFLARRAGRLRHVVGGTARERFEGGRAGALGEGTEHDDGELRCNLADIEEDIEAGAIRQTATMKPQARIAPPSGATDSVPAIRPDPFDPLKFAATGTCS